MREIVLSQAVRCQLEDIYQKLQLEYERVAGELDFTCTACPDNCCDSYFLHHTYLEWVYLWEGVRLLPKDEQRELVIRAEEYLARVKEAVEKDERPQVMCPINKNGLCTLYKHRLLVCRTHGVPARLRRPDGQTMIFPGCFRCQDIVKQKKITDQLCVERTSLLQRLACLENDLLGGKRYLYPKVKMTIAEMLVAGPPAR